MKGCNHVRRYQQAEEKVMKGSKLSRSSGCNHVRRYAEIEQQYQKDPERFFAWKSFRRCKHGVEGYCRQCLAEIKPEPEYWGCAPAKAKHDINSKPVYYDPLKSFGCRSCNYVLSKKATISLLNYAKQKSFTLTQQDIEDAIQQSMEYILRQYRKPEIDNRWLKTLKTAVNKQGEKIPAIACFCRLARSKLKNIIRSHVKMLDTQEKVIIHAHELSQLQRPENDFKHSFLYMSLEETLTQDEFKLLKLRYAGYTLREIAEKWQMDKNTIHRREKELYKKCHDIQDTLKSMTI